MIGLAVLTKGPVGLLIFGLAAAAYLVVVRFRIKFKFHHILLFLAGLVLTGGSWFAIQLANGHADVVMDFIVYQAGSSAPRTQATGAFRDIISWC